MQVHMHARESMDIAPKRKGIKLRVPSIMTDVYYHPLAKKIIWSLV